MLKKLISFLKSFFKKFHVEQSPKISSGYVLIPFDDILSKQDIKEEYPPIYLQNPILSVKPDVTPETVRKAYLEELFKYDGLREEGKNRGEKIDQWNESLGVPLGSPYCISGPQVCMDVVEKALGIKFKRLRTASTQEYAQWMAKHLPESIIAPQDCGAGDILLFQSRTDANRGHFATALGPFKNQVAPTLEFNTNYAGSRDGEGVMSLSRHMDGTTGLKLKYVIRFWKFYDVV